MTPSIATTSTKT
ncbi:hypothetical protein MTR67_001008 [Solanum verrucosum]|uniref:Uncharacterized protein n=1 Tax=Solanum verrucosum TaxID=315347 RepID=A0AAF0PMP1_SOLVR|nr:hypothetical protein MTR67_001008 [Solanum verrucosum]